jgi:OPA family glycerol-3-phosphate transporter-like MFS transporter 1/2
MNVRYFLSFGMVMAGVFSFLFGLAYWADIHAYGYFIAVQVGHDLDP